ncbi:MAG: AI-2E family transporter [Minisyncoccia bacterium]
MENKQSVSISTGTIVRTLLVLLGFYIAWYTRGVLLVITLSIIIASFMEVVSNSLKRRFGWSRHFVVIVSYLIGIVGLGLIMYFVIPLLVDQVSSLADQLVKVVPNNEYVQSFKANGLADKATMLFQGLGNNASVNQVLSGAKGVAGSISSGILGSIGNVFSAVVQFVLVLVISFFLSMQEKSVETFIRTIAPARYEDYVLGLWERTEKKIARWMQGQLLLGVFVGVTAYIILTLFHVKYALVLALLSGILELIPYGITFAVIPAAAVALFNNGASVALGVLVSFVAIQQFENYVLVPVLFKKMIGVPPLVVILALLMGGALGGFVGLILAMPVAVLVLEVLDDVYEQKITDQKKLTEQRVIEPIAEANMHD